MNQFAQYITKIFIRRKVLEELRESEYVYVIETTLEKVILYSIFLTIAIWLQVLCPTIVFLMVFLTIRGRTGGFHMNTYTKCLVGSVSIYLFLVLMVMPKALQFSKIAYIIFSISVVFIVVIGTVNHPNMNLDLVEYIELKKSARLLVILHWSIITVIWGISRTNIIILYAMLADVLCAILLLLGKLKKQEVTDYE